MTFPVWTIGHSTRAIADFEHTLVAHGIEVVIDVRRFPASRRLPQFESSSLEHALARTGIAYRWIPELGGRRRATGESVVSAWRHPAFRAYAEHVRTEPFADGLIELLGITCGLRSAIMCAEILWWRCHRRLIADVLTSIGIEVIHIRDATHAEVHGLAAPARLVGGTLTYESDPG
jgi:uncharacterized protein (DUF488 family)